MSWYVLLPGVVFWLVLAGETLLPTVPSDRRYGRGDWLLNLAGFAAQGVLVPVLGIGLSWTLAARWPSLEGAMGLGPVGAFALNVVGVDLLYYLQHRAFHRWGPLWTLHRCHHASPVLDVWATARNTLWINPLFVYLLVNPVLAFLCGSPDAFWLGAMVTASLDLVRHTRLDLSRTPLATVASWAEAVFVTPRLHRWHHGPDPDGGNYGANLIVWDRLFGTFHASGGPLPQVGVPDERPALRQWLAPWGDP